MQDTSPLEAIERSVLVTRANREELEDTLRTLPRWRFRRRRAVEGSVRRRLIREQRLLEVLTESSSERDNSLIR